MIKIIYKLLDLFKIRKPNLGSRGADGKAVHKKNQDAQISRDIGLRDAALSGWFQNQTGEVFTGVPICETDIVVDVGCGDGGILSFCANRGAHVVGVEVDEQALQAAKQKLDGSRASKKEFHLAEGEKLPLSSGFATRVICTEVLEHVENPQLVLKELFRIGAENSLYLITIPDSLQEAMQKHVADDLYFQHPNHIRIIDREKFPEMIREAGLEVVSQSGYGFYWGIWWAMFWGCECDFKNPEHQALINWAKAWSELIKTEKGRKIKKGLDAFLPKSQVIVAKKNQSSGDSSPVL